MILTLLNLAPLQKSKFLLLLRDYSHQKLEIISKYPEERRV